MSDHACPKCHILLEGDNYCHDCGCCWTHCHCDIIDNDDDWMATDDEWVNDLEDDWNMDMNNEDGNEW